MASILELSPTPQIASTRPRRENRHRARADARGRCRLALEMGEVTVIESAPEATVKAEEVPPPPVEGTPNPVRAEGEMI